MKTEAHGEMLGQIYRSDQVHFNIVLLHVLLTADQQFLIIQKEKYGLILFQCTMKINSADSSTSPVKASDVFFPLFLPP